MSDKALLQRLRLHYRKDAVLMYIGHLDLMRFIYRCFRRSNFPYSTSGFYSPKPSVTFGPTLSLGVMADAEVLDVEIRQGAEIASADFPAWLDRLAASSAPRECFYRITELAPGTPPIARAAVSASYTIKLARRNSGAAPDAQSVISAMQPPLVVVDRDKPRDLEPALQSWELKGRELRLTGSCSGSLHINVVLLAKLLEQRSEVQALELRRISLLSKDGAAL
jgi:radical SAM-linked protein